MPAKHHEKFNFEVTFLDNVYIKGSKARSILNYTIIICVFIFTMSFFRIRVYYRVNLNN